jgi:outer membrane protein OmpA-like peptidoglycan-associated protein
MRVIIAALAVLITGNAVAQCDSSVHMFNIPYVKNSSYFPSAYSTRLDEISEEHKSKNGYLLLEFQVQKNQKSDELRAYNLWLAERRIHRVKSYLTESSFPAPIVTRILTAGMDKRRDISVTWCPIKAPTVKSFELAE